MKANKKNERLSDMHAMPKPVRELSDAELKLVNGGRLRPTDGEPTNEQG